MERICKIRLVILMVALYFGGSEAQSCTAPTSPGNGTVVYPALTDGSNATYDCNLGYVLVGPSIVTCVCLSGTCNWDSAPPTCPPVDCGFPGANPNSMVSCTQGTTYTRTCTAACDLGFTLTSGSTIMSCLYTGLWDFTPPVCQIVDCVGMTPPANGNVTYLPGTTYQDVAVFTCNPGYSLNGCCPNRTCQADGSWSNNIPWCLANVCTEPTLTDGTVTCTSLLATDTCTFACNVGYDLTGATLATCLTDGTWDYGLNPPPTCTLNVSITTITTSTTTTTAPPTTTSTPAAPPTTTAPPTCNSRWASPVVRHLQLYTTPLPDYTLIAASPASSAIKCVTSCLAHARVNCGSGSECGLAMYDSVTMDCSRFYPDAISGVSVGCNATSVCYRN